MREIKFKAWDGKTMAYTDQSYWFRPLLNTSTRTQQSITISTALSDPNIKVMQFTGLKDKNGVEIYEGDVVRYYHHQDDVSVISWDDVLLSHKVTVVSEGVYCEDYFFIKSDSPKFEVIGNIYENPELLSDAQ